MKIVYASLSSLLTDLKEREPAMKALTKRVEGRKGGAGRKSKKGAATVADRDDAAALIEEEEQAAEEAAGVGAAVDAPRAPTGGSRPQPRRAGPRDKRGPGGKRR